MPRAQPTPRFEIWEVGDRIHSIDNPVRLKLLHAMEERPRRLPDLVRLTGKAKSTLSELHVRPLVQAGLVAEEPDPRDARSKTYRLVGQRLGSSEVDATRLRASVLRFAGSAGRPTAASMLELVDPATLVASGADRAYVDAVADRLGAAWGGSLRGRSAAEVVAAIDAELEKAGRARIRWRGTRPHAEAVSKALAEFWERTARAAIAAASA